MNVLYSRREDNGEHSCIGILNNPLKSESIVKYWDWLETMDDFKGGTTEFGVIPREQKFYDEEERYFGKEWKNKDLERWKAHTYDETLVTLQEEIQDKIDGLDIFDNMGVNKPRLNSCLINKYFTGQNSIKPHRDSHDTFGENPTVVGLSLGDERTIRFNRIIYDPANLRSIKIDDGNPEQFDIPLPHGSIMIMAGAVQKYFSHEIPKCEGKDLRYSLTFREYL